VKRFWTTAETVEAGDGFGIALDGKAVRTPARAELVVGTSALADAIAREWAECADQVDPRAMPLTGLANAAIDRIAPDPGRFAVDLAKYAEGDLLCYRADGPEALVARETELWDPLLGWARRRFDVDFTTAGGVMHVPQPRETVRKLGHEVASLAAFTLAGLSPLVTIGGSLVAALAVLEESISLDAAWDAVSLDERWQLEQWGADTEAEAALSAKREDFLAAARFLDLLS